MTITTATLTVTLVDGTQVVVPDTLEQITPYVLQEQGDWFEDEIKFLRRLVQPGQTVVDIGANVGVYALSLARRVGPTGQVWAFEPASDTAALLQASIAANATPWLNLQRQALSDHGGRAWLQTPGLSELNSLASKQQGPGEEVSLTTLDACLEEFGWQQVDLLKIDAEGEEERILSGGSRFLAELSPLVMFELRAGSELHLELVERFQALGYGCYRLVPGLDALMPFDPADGVDGYLRNLFAAKPDRTTALEAGGRLVKKANPEGPPASELEPYQPLTSIAKLPYAKHLASRWKELAENESKQAVDDALASWLFANDPARPMERRLGALRSSYSILLQQATTDCISSIQWSSLARVAQALGERAVAVRALGNLIPSLQASAPEQVEEPFLPPLQRYEALAPGKRLGDWLLSSALEADELLGAYSGYYSGDRSRARLERLIQLGYSSEEDSVAQRRMQLLERRLPRLPQGAPEQARQNEKQLKLSKEAWQLLQAGKAIDAEQSLKHARQMGIDCPSSLHYIAKCLAEIGCGSEAIALLQRAVELNPSDPALLVELGLTLRKGAHPSAGEAVLQQAVFLYGMLLSAGEGKSADYANLAIAFDELGDSNNALVCLEQSLHRDPRNESALLRKASILGKKPDSHNEAEVIWKGMLEGEKHHLGALAHTIDLRITQGELSEAEKLLQDLLADRPYDYCPHYLLAFIHSISGEDAVAPHLAHLRRFWTQARSNRLPAGSSPQVLTLPPAKGQVRVGILSAEIGDHVVSFFLEPFLRHYSRERLEVELIEMKEHHGTWANQLRALADAVIPLHDVTQDEARRRIRSRAYHVIVETSGFTSNSGIALLEERCAPVQCHYIGFHASTGLDTIDWFIGDEITAAPELAHHFVETLWRLQRPWLACHRWSDLPEANSSLASCPAVLGSFNQFGKVREETLSYWCEALRLIPESELHLKSASSDSSIPRQRILQGLERRGVDAARVKFMPRTQSFCEHLACYNGIDIALDTTPWAGATTSFEALAMGVPVVGILGGTTAGRMTCAALHGIGRTEWIARDPIEFASIVQRLANNVNSIRVSKATLQQEVLASPLFDGADLARHLEATFLTMARGCGEPERP